MPLYYSLSDIVILGGSFVRKGGHNPVEPANNNCVEISNPITDMIEVFKIDKFCKVSPLFSSYALYILMHIIEITDKASKILPLDSIKLSLNLQLI